ncbi:MAG: hypothetical protein A2527_05430 [Candidatus Lambdaproteobacteria bacterium RIFOXYD2_FULL_50_16]|uniref:Cytochrome oxidase assembly protein n=1 Tax=Candidatus Lambdaproteobacteria bacterium RIFOXYD2_FULL_50_16 TaxID=1817772 RepID=A0A1F6G984_9PROT|nr:MAG: hypothetical protein A2527_05430 [Candidatus Lambdaproteobacteria bacterium RIFOXYD2_FULL_50_16]
MKLNRFAKFAWGILIYNLWVILWGAYVRATGSGAGCGRHWPTCNGEVIPVEPRIQTLIEFSHRSSSGLALVTILVLLFWAFKAYPKGHPVRLGAALSTLFMLTEAGLGAGLVLFELVAEDTSMARVYSMALHLINTFILLSSITLTCFWASGGPFFTLKGQGKQGAKIYLGLAFVILIGVTGAVTALGDTLFPPQQLGAGFMADGEGGVYFLKRLRIFHPILATSLGLYFVYLGLFFRANRYSVQTRQMGALLAIIYGVQVAVGALNIYLHVPAWSQLIHLLGADLLWITLVLLGANAFTRDPEGD